MRTLSARGVIVSSAMAAVVWMAPVLSAALPDDLAIALKSRVMQPGELVVVTVTTTLPAERIQVRAFGREAPSFRIDPLTWRALLGIDLDTAPGAYTVAVEAHATGKAVERGARELVVTPREFPTRQLKVDNAFVNPPPEVMDRITREAQELARLWTASAPERLWSGAFERPVPHEANSAFGTRSVFNGQPRSPHSGADFSSPAGTPIRAPNGGRVVLARDLYFSGNTVIIDHGLGLFSTMAHLSSIDVNPGDAVRAGQVVGAVGATGRVTGAHLHWAVRLAGARIDPLSLLAVLGGS